MDFVNSFKRKVSNVASNVGASIINTPNAIKNINPLGEPARNRRKLTDVLAKKDYAKKGLYPQNPNGRAPRSFRGGNADMADSYSKASQMVKNNSYRP